MLPASTLALLLLSGVSSTGIINSMTSALVPRRGPSVVTDAARRYRINRNIGQVLQQLLLATAESRGEVSSLLGIHPKTLGRRINGHHDWTAVELYVLAEHFDVGVERFYADPRLLLGLSPSDIISRFSPSTVAA